MLDHAGKNKKFETAHLSQNGLKYENLDGMGMFCTFKDKYDSGSTFNSTLEI